MNLSQSRKTKYSDKARFKLLADVFNESKISTYTELSGNIVYDTVAVYCEYLNVPVAGYNDIKDAYGESFTCADIARISHLVSRRTKLDAKWYEGVTLPFIGYYGEDSHPVLCIPGGKRSTDVYDLAEERIFKVDEDNEAEFANEGIVFCRPFPRRSLDFKDVLSYGRHYIKKSDIFSLILMTLLCTLVGLLLPTLNERLFDTLIPMGSFEAITELGVVILSCSVGNILFQLMKNLSGYRIVALPQFAIMDATIERLYHLPQRFIESFGSIDLVTRLFSFIQSMSSITATAVSAGLGSILSLIYLVRMFIKSKKLTWAVLIILAINIIVILIYARERRSYNKKSAEDKNTADNILYSDIMSIMELRLSMMEDKAKYDYQFYNTKAMKNDLAQSKLSIISSSLSVLISSAMTIAIYFIFLRKNLNLSLGKFTGFMSTMGLFTSAIMQMVDLVIMIPQIKPVVDRAMPIYEQECEDYKQGSTLTRFNGNIEVDKVSFAYGKDEPIVLNSISFKVNKGEYIGIVGPTGCGKSTLLKLLLGFEKATSGSIYYDDKEIDFLDKLELRRQMGVVLQDGKLISGTIYDNVALSAPTITEQRAVELLTEAGMKEDIDRMPMGVNTYIAEFGGTISGGQQQRILIARALANDPAMLLFDEATSALDMIAQDKLCDTLAQRNITRIVIAHRLATVRKCDRIIVMEGGRITEEGTFEELAKAGGLFSRLLQEQNLT